MLEIIIMIGVVGWFYRTAKQIGHNLSALIEAVEHKDESWFAVGVQWQPASPTASGLDIQIFRALVDAAKARVPSDQAPSRKMALAG